MPSDPVLRRPSTVLLRKIVLRPRRTPAAPPVDTVGLRPPAVAVPTIEPASPAPAPSEVPGRGRRAGRALVTWATGHGGDAGAHGVEVLGRTGLVAYGVLHLLLAGLAGAVMFGDRLVHADQGGAIAVVAGIGPVGAVLLGLAIIGLVAFGFWQVRAALGGFRWTSGGERLRKRFGAVGKAVAMFSIASIAFPPAIGPLRGPPPGGPPPPSTPHAVNDLVATVLDLPAGRLLVGVAAIAVLAAAAGMCWTGLRATYLGDLRLERLTPRWRRIAVVAGSYGNLARSALTGSVGVLLVAAAVTDDPGRSGGFTHAMRFIEGGPWGLIGLGVVGGGLAAFGVYCIIDAYARRA